MKRTITHNSKRAAVVMLTVVALGSTVSAPFKWSMMLHFW
jgi:hypothetical protein